MTPQISEFSYGFALTNELVGWLNLKAAPIFPSLLEEGKAGGGYDVKFEKPGVPLYLQFKRAEFMMFPNAKQFKQVTLSGQYISLPFFRFYLMQPIHSHQHEMLLELDNGKNAVFYAAPRFYKTSDINSAWTSKTVADQSIFVAPATIGALPDSEKHCIAYDANKTYFCSNPQPIEALGFQELQRKLSVQLSYEDRPLREIVDEAIAVSSAIRDRPRSVIIPEATQTLFDDDAQFLRATKSLRYQISRIPPGVSSGVPKQGETPVVPPEPLTGPDEPKIRDPRERDSSERALETLAEIAMRDFDTQLVIVQAQD